MRPGALAEKCSKECPWSLFCAPGLDCPKDSPEQCLLALLGAPNAKSTLRSTLLGHRAKHPKALFGALSGPCPSALQYMSEHLRQWLTAELPVTFSLMGEAAEAYRIIWDADPASLQKTRERYVHLPGFSGLVQGKTSPHREPEV